MAKYIDADKLKAEFDRQKIGYNLDRKHTAEYETCVKIIRIIDSLQQEQPEIDIKKELYLYICSDEYMNTREDGSLLIARHFYELGLKARKED